MTGLLLARSSFEAAQLRASLPAITAFEHVVAVTHGISVPGEKVRTRIAMIVGVVLLTRPPMLAPQQLRQLSQV